jgi:hypothetical protein
VLANRLNIDLCVANEMLTREKDFCDICGSTSRLHYDHCHETNKFRGVLCTSCNTLIGRMGDNVKQVKLKAQKMIDYLSK